MNNTVWFAFQVSSQQLPTPDDIIGVSAKLDRLLTILRERAEAYKCNMSTSGNPMFQYEFRRQDNTIHSFISVKEMPLL